MKRARSPKLSAVITSILLFNTIAFANECDEILVKGYEPVIKVGFTTPQEIVTTALDTVAIVKHLARIRDRHKNDLPPQEILMGLILLQTVNLHKQFMVRFKNEPRLVDEYRKFIAGVDPLNYDFEALYNRPESAALYTEFVSAIQRYFSAIMITYTAVRSELALKERLQLLDLGTGVGDTIYSMHLYFPNSQVTALDKSEHLLKAVSRRYDRSITIQADFDGRPLPFKNDTYDLISVICSANQHLPLDRFLGTLQEAHRVLKPGGYIIVEYGPWNQNVERTDTIEKFLDVIDSASFETETRPAVRIELGNNYYYPVLLRKPATR